MRGIGAKARGIYPLANNKSSEILKCVTKKDTNWVVGE
jgi:hypothetical protein